MQFDTSEPNPAPKDLSHTWGIAALILVDHATAKQADFRGSARLKEGQRVEALETYCVGCRRPFTDVADQECQAKINNQHLIGGDQRERAKRKVVNPPPSSVPVPAPRINRRGGDTPYRL